MAQFPHQDHGKISITTFSRLSSGISFGIPILLCLLYCSDLAWLFSRLMIHSSSFAFTLFTTVRSLLIFSLVECSWDIVSFSFDIWLQRLEISESTITFPFKAIIFCTSSGFFMAFIADSDKVNKLVLSPILIWPSWEVHVGKWDLDFKIEFLRFWMYVLPLRQKLGLEVYAEEAWKPTLHILTFIGESVAYSSNHLINFFIQLWFIPFHFSHSYDYCKIVEENFNVVVQERTLMVFPKSWAKTFIGVFTVFLLLVSVHWFEKENQVATYSIKKV